MAVIDISLILAGIFVGWSIGSNDAANAIGPTVGSGLLSYRRAVILFAFFAVLGGILQGAQVLDTVGSKLVSGNLSQMGLIAVMVVSSSLAGIASKYGLPISTSQALVGGLIGAGVATQSSIDWALIIKIFQTWLILPFGVAVLTAILYYIAQIPVRRAKNIYMTQRVLGVLLILASSYLSFSVGANHAGTSMGAVMISGINLSSSILSFLGGFAIAIGAITYSKNVVSTVGGGVTELDPLSAFVSIVSASIGIHVFSIIGLPVSTSHAVIGSILGVGITKGLRTVSKRKLSEIVAGWVATPTISFLIVYLIHILI